MPLYSFQHPTTGKIRDEYFGMNDKKIFIDEKGVEWKRVWTVPNAAIDTQIDPNNPKDFIRATNKPGTLGQMQDRSAELSHKRADRNGGLDPVKEQFYNDYSSKRHGTKHPDVKAREAKAKLKKLGVELNG